MGKFTLLFSGLLLTASTVAASTSMPESRQLSAIPMPTERAAVQKPAKAIEPKVPLRQMQPSTMLKAKAAEDDAEWPVITEAPAGKTVIYNKTCEGMYPYIYWLIEYSEDCGVGEMVFTDDNEVYIKDIFTNAQTGTYVKGTVADGVITVEMNQCIYFSDYYGYGYKLAALKESEEEYFTVDETIDKVTYTVSEDGTITLSPGTVLGLAYTDDGTWGGYADYTQSYTVFTDKPLSKPESVTTEKWALLTPDEFGHTIEVGFDGSDIYIGGLAAQMPDAWIKGTVTGDEVTFEGKQYMGTALGSHQYLMIGEYGEPDMYGDPTTELTDAAAVFKYDAEAKTITPADEKILLVNGSLTRVYYLERYEGITMYYLGEFKPAVPANPTDLFTEGFDPDYGYGVFEFKLPLVDTDGKLLDPSCYTYNIYVDDELFTLYPDEYTALDDELTDIPYNFTDSYDLLVYGSVHDLYYYIDGFDTIGVQAIYTVDGVTHKSALVNLNIETGETNVVEPAGISAITASKEVTGVEYFDLTGRKLTNPTTGIVIKRTTYSDGSVKSIKRVSR